MFVLIICWMRFVGIIAFKVEFISDETINNWSAFSSPESLTSGQPSGYNAHCFGMVWSTAAQLSTLRTTSDFHRKLFALIHWAVNAGNDLMDRFRAFKSVLTGNQSNRNDDPRPVFGSHNWHELTMFYPMRSIRTNRFKLIQNLNHRSPFGIDQDLYVSPSFQYILHRSHRSLPLQWIRNLTDYYYRPEWELFDLMTDPGETRNVYHSLKRKKVVANLKKQLREWRNATNDPFICYPHSVLEDTGLYKHRPQCLPLFNRKKDLTLFWGVEALNYWTSGTTGTTKSHNLFENLKLHNFHEIHIVNLSMFSWCHF